jgi:hypothetical protein
MKNPILNFYTFAFGRYKLFILPYITSALHNNKNAIAEVLVDNINFLNKKQRQFLHKYFPNRVFIRGIPKQFKNWKHGKRLKSIRWLTIPQQKAKYTYIGDVDILIFDSNLHVGHVNHCTKIKKPYSNIVRPNGINMTGLHFTITEPYYSVINQKYLNNLILQIPKMSLKSLDDIFWVFI